jgi:hypothetical protein
LTLQGHFRHHNFASVTSLRALLFRRRKAYHDHAGITYHHHWNRQRSAKPLYSQMNLPLFNLPATATPDEQQNELTEALMELLINAAEAQSEQPGNGGDDESETHA